MISVVIPLYNKEKSIASTLQSVYEQTYKDYEVVIVNDGSTDESLKVVQDFIRKVECGKWKVESQANAGVSAARNTGIMAAKGEYVAFLDGDDIWDKDFLQSMADLIKDYPGKSIYGLGCVHINRGEKLELEEKYYRGLSTWDYATMAFTGSSTCVNKEDAVDIGLFDMRMTHGEDLDMWWRLMLLHGGVSDTRPYAYYIQDAENRAMHRIAPLEKHIPYYIDKFAHARETNMDFRRFFDKEMIYRLYPYMFDKRYRKEAKRLAAKMDYSLQKKSLRWRLIFPHLYRLFTGR